MAGNNVTFGVRLRADGQGFIGSVRLADAEMQKLARSIREAGASAEKDGRKIAQAGKEAETGFKGAAAHVAAFGRNLTGLTVGGFALKQIADSVIGVGRALLTAQANAEKFATSLKFATGGGQAEVAREMNFVVANAQRLGLELNSAGSAYAKLAAASRGTRMEGTNARQVFLAVGEAATVMGLSASEAEGALLAVQQMISKGTVQAEELRGQLGERLPGAFQIAARAMGVTTQELGKMLEQGQVIADDFLPKFAQQLRQELSGSVGEASKNVNAAVNRMATGWELLKRETAQSGIGKFIAGQLTILGDAFTGVAEKIKKAREEGAGFWGSMWAGAKGVAAFANPANAFSYSAQSEQARADQLLAEIQRRTRTAADLRERGMHGLANSEVAEVIKLTHEYNKLAGAIQKAADAGEEREDQASRVMQRLARGASQETGFRRLLESSGTMSQRAGEARRRLYSEFGGLGGDDFRMAETVLMRGVYGARGFNVGMAREGNFMEREADQAKLAVERLKAAYRDGEMAASQYFASVLNAEMGALDAREQSIRRQIALAEEEGKWTDKSADIERLRGQLEAVGRERVALTERVEREVSDYERRAGEERLGIASEVAKRRGDLESAAVLDAVQKYGEALKKAVANGEEGLADEIRALILGAAQGGQFEEAKRDAEALLAEFARSLEQIERAGGEEGGLLGALHVAQASTALREKLMPQLRVIVEAMRALAKDNPALLKVVEDIENKMGDAAHKSTESWRGFVDNIDRTFRDGFVRMLEDGKEGWKSFTDSLRHTFLTEVADQIYKAFVKPIIVRFASSMSGAFSSTAPPASGPASGGGMGMWGNILGGAAGGYAIGGAAHSMFGNNRNAAGMSIGGALGGAAGMAVGMSSAAMGATYGAAAGPIGMIIGAIIGLVLGSLVKSGGGPKGGGSFYGNFDATGRLTGRGTVPGTDNGRFFTPSSGDSVARQWGEDAAASYYRALYDLGGTGGAASFGIGFDTDPRGTAPNRLSSSVMIGGRQVWSSRDRDIGREEGDIEPQVELEQRRMVLAALQASDLPGILGRLVNSLDATTASLDQIDKVLGFARTYRAVQQLTAPGAARDRADDRIRGSTALGAYEMAGESLGKVVDAFEAGRASADELAAATNAYVEAQANLLVQIEQVKRATAEMFADTRRNIEMGGLTEQEKYDYLRAEADRLYAQLQTATDPEEVARLSSRINADLNEAFGMLDDEEQRRRRREFLSSLDTLEETVTARLNAIGEGVEEDDGTNPNSVLRRASEAMDTAAQKMIDAADTMNGAATTIANNSDHNVNVTVRVQDDRVTAQVGG
jgi:tape measure domain-containing protein